MAALALYVAVAAALLFAAQRFVRMSRAAALTLLLLPMLFTGRALLTNRVYAPIDLPFQYEPLASHAAQFGVGKPHEIALSDLAIQIIPWQQALRFALRNGEWPLWNPFILCGDVLAAAAQPAVYDPFTLIALVIPIADALTFGATLTLFLAALFTFVFARSLDCSEVASLVAAAGYAFSSMMAFYVGWPLARSWALLPLVLIAVRLLVTQRRMALLIVALTLLIFAGHPESVLHVVAIGAAYGVFELRRGDRLKPVLHAFVAGALVLGLTAIFLLPFFEAAPQSAHHLVREQFYAKTPYSQLVSPEARRQRIERTFVSFARDQDPLAARAGSVILALALSAVVLAPRRREVWFFFALAVAGVTIACAIPPLPHLLHRLPLFDIAINERFAFAAAFAMSILAAMAIDAWQRRASLILIAAGAALAIVIALTNAPHMILAELVPLALLAAMPKRFLPYAALALVLVQRSVEDGSIYPAIDKKAFYPRVPLIAQMRGEELFRVAGTGTSLIPNTAAMWELEDVRGYNALTFLRLTETWPLWSRPQGTWFSAVDDPHHPFLSMLNVRYVVDGKRLIENPDALPRAFIPRFIRYEREGAAVLEGLTTARDFAERAWIETAQYAPHDAPNGAGSVTIRRDGLAYDLDANMQSAGWIVVSESAWNGWRAYIDGNRVATHFANHAFLGIYVPEGHHRVRLVYLPSSFTTGRWISLATLLVCLAMMSRDVAHALARHRRDRDHAAAGGADDDRRRDPLDVPADR